jgi:outer membrane protein OmpA-like peptidoglycan-associated protein
MNAKNIFGALAFGLLIAACSSEPKTITTKEEDGGRAVQTNPQASMMAKQVAAEQDAPYVAEISFPKGSTTLTADAKRKLQQLFKSVSSPDQVKSVKVVTWADQDYPSEQAKKLADNQVQIAKKRNEEIQKYLQTNYQDLKMDLHSMAERPAPLKGMLGTSDARIKRSMEEAGIPTTDSVKNMPSKASKSIVMLTLKDDFK